MFVQRFSLEFCVFDLRRGLGGPRGAVRNGGGPADGGEEGGRGVHASGPAPAHPARSVQEGEVLGHQGEVAASHQGDHAEGGRDARRVEPQETIES